MTCTTYFRDWYDKTFDLDDVAADTLRYIHPNRKDIRR